MKSVPGTNCISDRDTRRRSEWVNVWSLLEAHSRSSIMAIRFSPRTARMPPGTPAGTPMQLTEPFCVPCEPAALVTNRQRDSRYSIDLPSAKPICTSEPVPEVKRIFRPREA